MTSNLSVKSEYFDLSYATEPTSSFYLLAEIDGRSINVAWYHDHKRLITGFASYDLESTNFAVSIPNLLNKLPSLNGNFKECIVSIRSGNYAMIPRTGEGFNKRDLFAITNKITDEHPLLEYHLINLPVIILYAAEPEQEQIIKNSFFNCRVIPHTAPRIESFLNECNNAESPGAVLVTAQNELVDICIFENGKLLLCNSYFQTGIEDIAYYALYCSEVCNVNPDNNLLILSGRDASTDEFYKLIKSYWNKVSYLKSLEGLEMSEHLSERPPGQFDYLTHHLLCAS